MYLKNVQINNKFSAKTVEILVVGYTATYKGALSPFSLSVTFKSQVSEIPKIGVQFCLKLDYKCSKST